MCVVWRSVSVANHRQGDTILSCQQHIPKDCQDSERLGTGDKKIAETVDELTWKHKD